MKHPKNKGERLKTTYNKFVGRLKKFHWKKDNIEKWMYKFKNHSTICSCSICKSVKTRDKMKHSDLKKL